MARNFTTTGDSVRNATADGPRLGNGSAAIWIKPNFAHTDTADVWFTHFWQDASNELGLRKQGTTTRFGWLAGGVDSRISITATASMFTSGTGWLHLLTWDDTNNIVRWYVNGTEVGSRVGSAVTTVNLDNGITIGKIDPFWGTGNVANAHLANLAWWDHVLTASERALLFATNSPEYVPTGRIDWMPILGNSPEVSVDRSDSYTVTGTTVTTHPTSTAYDVEQLAPDAVLANTGLISATITDLDEDPDADDAAWAVASTNNTTTQIRFSFPTPTGTLATGAGLQQFRALVRKQGGTGTPTATMRLYESGTLVASAAAQNVTSTTGQILTYSFDASLITNPANVELLIDGSATGGAGGVRAAVDYGAVDWIAIKAVAGAPTGTGGVTFGAPSLAGSATETITGSGGVTFATPAMAGSGTSVTGATGTGGVSFTAPSLASTGTETIVGTGAILILQSGGFSLLGNGFPLYAAVAGIIVPTPSLSGSGTVVDASVTGSGGVAFGALTLAGAGTEAIASSGGVSFAVPALAGAGVETVTSTGAIAFAVPSLAGTGAETIASSGGVAFGISLTGAGVEAIAGSGGITITGPSLEGQQDAPPSVSGTGSVAFGFGLAGTATETFTASGAVAIAPSSLAGTATETIASSGALTIVAPSLAGTGTQEITITGSGGVAFVVPSLAGSSGVLENPTGAGGVSIAAPVLVGVVLLTIIGAGAVAIGGPTLQGSEITYVLTSVGGSDRAAIVTAGSSRRGLSVSGRSR